jgi:hypothetical protein
MEVVSFECLDKAIATKLPVTLTGKLDGKAFEIAAKFIAESADDANPGIWLQPTTPSAVASKMYARLAAEKIPLSATFCDAGTKVVFDTVVAQHNKHYWLNDRVVFEALLIDTPSDLSTPESRSARRYRISDAQGGVYGKLFRREGAGTKEIQATLWDLSTGGASFVCPMDKQLQSTAANELFIAMVHFRGKKLTLPARFTHARAFSSRTLRLGMRFDFTNPVTEPIRGELLKACGELQSEGK